MDQELQQTIRVVLLDEHCLFRASLARFLASEPGFEIAGECGSIGEALEVLRMGHVDMALLDFHLGAESGTAFIEAARQAGYQAKFLVVTGAPDARSVARALQLGASGIFLKSEPPKRLVHAMHLVANGELWVEPKVLQALAERVVSGDPASRQAEAGILNGRERTVLLGIIGGLTNRKIGDNMGLSESAVKNIVQRLFGKAAVKKRSQLVRVALEGSLATALNRQSHA